MLKQKAFLLFLIFITIRCGGRSENIDLQNGDLLFFGYELHNETSDFSSAINEVTQTGRKTNYTHVGIIEKVGYDIKIIHAAPQKGVCCEPLENFLDENGNNIIIDVYRLKPEYNHLISGALKKVKKYIGQPYDFTYLLNDSSQYCSGLIYKIFEDDSLFQLEPMTFKDPNTNEFLPFWIEHYKKLNIEIPENIPGCNPNGMATSSAIEFQENLKIEK